MNENSVIPPADTAASKRRRRGIVVKDAQNEVVPGIVIDAEDFYELHAHDVDVHVEQWENGVVAQLTQSAGPHRGQNARLTIVADRGFWPWSKPEIRVYVERDVA